VLEHVLDDRGLAEEQIAETKGKCNHTPVRLREDGVI